MRCAGPGGSIAAVAGRGTGIPAAVALQPHSAVRSPRELLPFTIGSRIVHVRV